MTVTVCAWYCLVLVFVPHQLWWKPIQPAGVADKLLMCEGGLCSDCSGAQRYSFRSNMDQVDWASRRGRLLNSSTCEWHNMMSHETFWFQRHKLQRFQNAATSRCYLCLIPWDIVLACLSTFACQLIWARLHINWAFSALYGILIFSNLLISGSNIQLKEATQDLKTLLFWCIHHAGLLWAVVNTQREVCTIWMGIAEPCNPRP